MNDETQVWAGPTVPLKSLEELADHHAVERLPKIYAIGLDLRDYDLCRSAYAPEAQIEGRDGWEPVDVSLKKTYAIASSFHATQHVISNQYVDLQGDGARVWSWGVAHHKVAPGEARDEIIAGVQYRDRCRRFSQGWLITERRLVMLWMDMARPRSAS